MSGAARDLPVDLRGAIEDCILGRSHLASQLGSGYPSAESPLADGVRHFGGESPKLQFWITWRALDRLFAAYTAMEQAGRMQETV